MILELGSEEVDKLTFEFDGNDEERELEAVRAREPGAK